MHFWTGLYAKVDRMMLINGVTTMLLRQGDRQDDENQNPFSDNLKTNKSA